MDRVAGVATSVLPHFHFLYPAAAISSLVMFLRRTWAHFSVKAW